MHVLSINMKRNHNFLLDDEEEELIILLVLPSPTCSRDLEPLKLLVYVLKQCSTVIVNLSNHTILELWEN